jgi:hypothetical protein
MKLLLIGTFFLTVFYAALRKSSLNDCNKIEENIKNFNINKKNEN